MIVILETEQFYFQKDSKRLIFTRFSTIYFAYIHAFSSCLHFGCFELTELWLVTFQNLHINMLVLSWLHTMTKIQKLITFWLFSCLLKNYIFCWLRLPPAPTLSNQPDCGWAVPLCFRVKLCDWITVCNPYSLIYLACKGVTKTEQIYLVRRYEKSKKSLILSHSM